MFWPANISCFLLTLLIVIHAHIFYNNHFRFLRLRFEFGSASLTCTCPFDFCSGNFRITKTALILLLSLLNFFLYHFELSVYHSVAVWIQYFRSSTVLTRKACDQIDARMALGTRLSSIASQPVRPKIEMRNGMD